MSDTELLPGEPEDTHEAIMWATFRALRKHGYAGISISRIADECEVSKSTLYHHFDDKEEILSSFMTYMREYLVRRYTVESTGDPVEDLGAYLRVAFGDYPPPESMPGAMENIENYIELRAQATRNPTYRAEFTELDAELHDCLVDIIETGIEQGVFVDVDPERFATYLGTMIDGSNLQRTTNDKDLTPKFREMIRTQIERELLVDGETL